MCVQFRYWSIRVNEVLLPFLKPIITGRSGNSTVAIIPGPREHRDLFALFAPPYLVYLEFDGDQILGDDLTGEDDRRLLERGKPGSPDLFRRGIRL